MIRRAFLIFSGVLFLLTGALQGCGTPVRDGEPVSITPNVVQTKVNDTVTLTVTLSVERKKPGKLFILIGDSSIILPANEKTEVPVEAGKGYVTFGLQGIKPGITTVSARMENEGAPVHAQVVVAGQ